MECKNGYEDNLDIQMQEMYKRLGFIFFPLYKNPKKLKILKMEIMEDEEYEKGMKERKVMDL